MGDLVRQAGLVLRYGLAGLVNTAIGFLVIAGLDVGLGLEPHLANAAGYVIGVVVSYGLNHTFVFRSGEAASRTGPRFLLAAGGAFLINQAALSLCGRLLSSGDAGRLASQAVAISAYTVVLFVACRLWVFRPGRQESQAQEA